MTRTIPAGARSILGAGRAAPVRTLSLIYGERVLGGFVPRSSAGADGTGGMLARVRNIGSSTISAEPPFGTARLGPPPVSGGILEAERIQRG
jgi:hypothetical protein